jgi:hypothetical protein
MKDYISENNAEKLATRRQLWAIYCLSKKDYRGQDLTRLDASNLIQRLKDEKAANETQSAPKPKKTTLEKEFIDYMTDKMQAVINTAKEALQLKSVVADDPNYTDPKKCKSYAMFGFGCGFTIIDFDKRSKVGKQIKELSSKHQMTTFLNMFLKAFTKQEIEYFQKVGCPLTALYYQDIRINGAYDRYVASFMENKGVKNVRTRTYYD